jgi:hypothetical protein
MGKLNTAKLRTLTKPGAYGDGAGLYLQVRSPEQRSWLFRFKIAKRGHLMGLGPFPDIGLSEAREAATEARKLLRQGINPIEHRKAQRAIATAPKPATRTFEAVARGYVAKNEVDWKNAKHREQWRRTLEMFAFPRSLTKSSYQQRFPVTSALVCVASGSGIGWRCVGARDAG